MNYEEKIERLEEIVKILEEGKVCLAESLELYEEAGKIVGSCYVMLEEGKGKIIEITDKLNQIDFDMDRKN